MLYSPKETAQQLYISPGYLGELTARGAIPASGRTSNGHARYTVKDIQRAKKMLGFPSPFQNAPMPAPSVKTEPVEPVEIETEVIDGGLGRIFV